MFSFEVLAEEGRARAGNLVTSHGSIETPSFVAVGTLAAVDPLSSEDLQTAGTQAIIANAFHLHLQPGEEIIKETGGLHRFMRWKRPIITDSGGYQIFSLGAGKETRLGKVASMYADTRRGRPNTNVKKEKPLLMVKNIALHQRV